MMTKSLDKVLTDLEQSDPKTFGRAIFLDGLRQALRGVRGQLSQEDVAERIGREKNEVSAIESGVTNLTPFGLILDYLESCGASIKLEVISVTGDLVSSLESSQTRTRA